MRIGSGMSRLFQRQWKPSQNARTAPGFGRDLEDPAEQSNALAHERESESPAVEGRLQNETRALVRDLDERLPTGAPRAHLLHSPARVQPTIGERLLEQTVDGDPDRKRGFVQRVVDLELDRRSGLVLEIAHGTPYSVGERQIGGFW